MEVYNKLVRDNIDDIINNNGKNEEAVTRILSDEEYEIELLNKLKEEFNELVLAINTGIADDIIEESADLIEVIRAINNDDLTLVLDRLESKKSKKGGFVKRKYLIEVKQKY